MRLLLNGEMIPLFLARKADKMDVTPFRFQIDDINPLFPFLLKGVMGIFESEVV
jgi:hypothetical protein